jgi:hypothetical protein
MWTQIVGKIVLELTPLVNHYWNVTFHLAARGLRTPALPFGDRTFAMEFNFVEHRLDILCSDGGGRSVELRSMTTAAFYALVLQALKELGIEVKIWPMPVEVANPIRFDEDTTHATYDAASALAFWQILRTVEPVFEAFRARFIGKCSPVHFFWGSFDLAVTRFSGRLAPPRPGADAVTRESYSHEVISHGFWPGGGSIVGPTFYAYAAPQPDGFEKTALRTAGAAYNTDIKEFVLPYAAIETLPSPEAQLTAFMDDTYVAGATLGKWDRKALERVQ